MITVQVKLVSGLSRNCSLKHLGLLICWKVIDRTDLGDSFEWSHFSISLS